MNKKSDDQWENELMETEDQLQKEMQEEFSKRLQSRLQTRVETKERNLCDVLNIKKKTRRTPSEKHLRVDRASRD